MLKIDSLRNAVTHSNRWSRANPDKMTIFVDSGYIHFAGDTPSFAYDYTVILFVMDFTGDINDFTIPVMRWLWFNQRDLLLNPEKNKEFKFSTAINDDDSADILFEFPLFERVKVTPDENGELSGEYLPEPRMPDFSTGGGWDSVFIDKTFVTTAGGDQ
ncbi:phage tail protein [Salmonella enterica subsp. enterica serovar Abaetetuba]|uniref:Phage tail protein n=1 Tax=Salmonella enterica subsp. enterica serovar Poona TaxID=436295 RepID=A0A5V6NJN4_SALET|nr:phage tail protein [Salmonella enterica]EAA7484657.1 phage tail protein [Salmonella enterica subsp. enterica serovar Irumu]EAB9234147.1 phage tail protein [Salmonella enterica subsp. enterica serovar Uganda]EAM4446625.1 phage tail protein [Salmonella enterica subsp. enterica serovar Infantis]EAR0343453.1 phage tail protein [Salmonella enterica subsp. enterica serovar Anatum]EBR3874072.1 phage tail protein [Salmonella enterica subsp. enterica]EBR8648676.1 phage tail protein [Salmonella ente